MKLKTKTGRLTAYAFACGYIERKTTGHAIETTLWKEHGTYHVRQYDALHKCRVFWQATGSLTTARQLFNQQPGLLHQN